MRLSGTKTNSIHQYRGLGNQLWDLAGVRPSLDLNFAHRKDLIDAVTGQPLVTFTRASSGTFVGSDGLIKTATTNEPRFDHNPTTGESLGLLVEESRANLLVRSEEFDNASWSKFQATVTANATTAPDGSSNADSLIESAIAGTHVAFQNATTSVSATQTFSVYAKANQRSRFQLYVSDTGANAISGIFNLSTGAVISATNAGTGSGAAASVISVGNGWYRCILTGIPASSGATVRAHCYVLDNSNNQSYTGDGTSGLYLWGAQLEAGAFPTSYIPTTAATVTRSADVASITGTAFSSWYRQDEGTVFVDGATPAFGATTGFVALNAAGTTNRIDIRQSRISPTITGSSVGAAWSQIIAAPTLIANTFYKQAVAVSSASQASSVSGALETSPAAVGTIAATQLIFGMRDSQTTPTGGSSSTIKRLTYWPTRLSNSTLQTITQ